MRRIKGMGLAAVAALALTASLGTASAGASTTFNASSYPAGLSAGAAGGASHSFQTSYWPSTCNSVQFSSALSAPSGELGATGLSPECTTFGVKSAWDMNGCSFQFHPGDQNYDGTYEGTFDIGPAGCGPIELEQFNCKIEISPQSGLAASFENTGSGTVRIKSEATDIEYSQVHANQCGGAASWSNGSYKGTWELFGGGGVDVFLDREPHAPLFESRDYPVTHSGAQQATSKHVINLGGSTVNCTSVSFSGLAFSAANAVALSPTYSGCNAFGFNDATVKTNGCAFSYGVSAGSGSNYSGSAIIGCPPGKAIEISVALCGVSIPAQSGLNTISYVNKQISGRDAIGISSAITGMTYQVTKSGFLCPLNSPGTYTNGKYTGGTDLQGSVNGSPTDIRIGT